jgi:hypothetical protein
MRTRLFFKPDSFEAVRIGFDHLIEARWPLFHHAGRVHRYSLCAKAMLERDDPGYFETIFSNVFIDSSYIPMYL